MPRSVPALINPEMLAWARESAGFKPEELARKLRLPVEKVQAWEAGTEPLSIPQLRKLAEACRRPIACFYLAQKPKGGPQPMRDLRRLHGAAEFRDTVALNLEIRLAEYRRQVVLDLLEEFGEKAPEFKHHINMSDRPEELGTRIRDLLKISFKDQAGWQNSYEGFNQWRTAVERLGTLVFQTSEVSIKEVRGFSLTKSPLPIIMLNTKDYYPARTFTLIHELAHVLLNQSGICDIFEEYKREEDAQHIEVFCNHVAGATLVPEKELRSEHESLKKSGRVSGLDGYAKSLANKFKVSREVILRRYLAFDYINKKTYEEKREELQKEYAELAKRARAEEKKFFRSIPREVLSKCGLPFVQLVLNGYHQERITSADVSEFLSAKLKYLPKIETEAISKSVKFGSV